MKKIAIEETFEMVLISAERYAIGRHSYWPPDCVAYIRGLLKDLSHNTLTVLFDDIDREIKRYERMNWQLSYRKEWAGLLEDVRQEIIARGGRTR